MKKICIITLLVFVATGCSKQTDNIEKIESGNNNGSELYQDNGAQNNSLPKSCIDELTIDGIKELIVNSALKKSNNEREAELIRQTGVKLDNIIIESKPSESNLEYKCSADMELDIPYADDETKSKIVFDIAITAQMRNINIQAKGRSNYKTLFSYDSSGNQQDYISLDDGDSYANLAYLFAKNYAVRESGVSPLTGDKLKENEKIDNSGEHSDTSQVSENNMIPQFKDYSTKIYNGKTAALAMNNDTAKTFRTRLRAALQEKPNFAGEYVVTMWGCGMGCRSYNFVNKRTGEVLSESFGGEEGQEVDSFKANSRLLVTLSEVYEDNSDTANYYAYFYELKDKKFHLIKKVKTEKPQDE